MRETMAKSSMDDIGETIKNVIFWKVKSGQIVVHTPNEFSDPAIKFVSSIITVYLPKSDEIVEPESIHQAPSIPETLLIHKFVWQRLQYRIFQDDGRPGSLSHSMVQKS